MAAKPGGMGGKPQRQREAGEEVQEEDDEEGGQETLAGMTHGAVFKRLPRAPAPHHRSGLSAIRSQPVAWLRANCL